MNNIDECMDTLATQLLEVKMSKEKEQVIEDIVKEVEGINNIAVIRFILDVVKAFKKSGKWDVA